MTDIENHGPETPQINQSAISDKDLAYISDFVKYTQVEDDGDFLSDYDYEDTNPIQAREQGEIKPELISLLNNLQSPDTADSLLDFLTSLGTTDELKAFFATDLVKHYFEDLGEYDGVKAANFKKNKDILGSDSYKDYKKRIDGIKDKYQKLLASLNGETKDNNPVKDGKKESKNDKGEKIEQEEGAELTLVLEELNPDDLPKFKEALTALQKGEVPLELLDPLNTITQVLKLMTKIDKQKVIIQVKKFIDTKKGDIASSDEKEAFEKNSKNFVDTLNIVLGEKATLDKFVETIDGELNGLLYDDLIEAAKDPAGLNAPEAKMALNTILHRDEALFNQLLTDFDSPNKKTAVENILKKYYKLSNTSPLAEGVTFERTQSKVGEKDNIEGFVIKKSDNNYVMNGSEPVFIHFGESGTADPMSLSKSIQENERVQSALKITDGKYNITPDTKKVIGELMQNKVTGSNVYANFGDALSAFFDTSMWDQIKIFFIALGTVGSEKEEDRDQAQLQIDYINMKSQWRRKYFKDKNGKDINYSYALSKYEPSSKEGNGSKSYKQLFINASPEVQANYIETAYMKGKEAGYAVLKENSPKVIVDTKVETPQEEIAGGVDVKTDIPSEMIDFESGKEIASLKTTPNAPGKIDFISNEDAPYLLVDGKVINLLPLSNGTFSGSLFVEMPSGQIQEKKINLATLNGKQTMAIENIGTPLDVSSSTNGDKVREVFENNVMKYPEGGLTYEQLPMRNYFAWSGDGPLKDFYEAIANIQDDDIRKNIQLSLSIVQASVNSVTRSGDQDIAKDVQGAIKRAKESMILELGESPDSSLISSIKNWAKMFGVEEDNT